MSSKSSKSHLKLFSRISSKSYRHRLYLKLLLIAFFNFSHIIAFFNFSHKRPTFAFTPEIEHTLGSLRKIVHSGLHAETQGFTHAAVWSVQLSSRIWTENSRRKRMHAYGVCPLPPASRPRWAA